LPKLDPLCAVLFRLMSAQIERISAVNSINGAKGGRPLLNEKSEKTEKSEAKRKKPTVPVSVSDTLSVSDTVTKSMCIADTFEPAAPHTRTRDITKTKYAEFVSMTDFEHASLVKKVGEDGAKRCVEILDNYKGSANKKYASDYRAILHWVIERYEEERARGQPKNEHEAREEFSEYPLTR